MAKSATNDKTVLPLHEVIGEIIPGIIAEKEMGKEIAEPYIIGTPGGGKTKMFEATFSKREGTAVLNYTPGLERQEKFGGIPDFYKKTNEDKKEELHTIWSIPQMITDIRDAMKHNERAIVLFDDWHLCDADIQKIGFELFTHRSLNGHKIPKERVHFILMGNEKSTAGAKIQLSAIKNRCALFHTKSDVNYWIENFATVNGIHPTFVSFFEQTANSHFFQEEESSSSPFGSPRSWTSTANIISMFERTIASGKKHKSVNMTRLMAALESGVSIEAARKFIQYYEIYTKVDIDTIFAKMPIKIDDDLSNRYAMVSAVENELISRYIDVSIEHVKTKNSIKFNKDVENLTEVCTNFYNALEKAGANELIMKTIRHMVSFVYTHENKEINTSSLIMSILKSSSSKKGAFKMSDTLKQAINDKNQSAVSWLNNKK